MQTFIRFAACAFIALTTLFASAQDRPAWASKGTGSLNRSRSNDSYELQTFNTSGQDRSTLQREFLEPLKARLASTLGIQSGDMSVDSTATADGTLYTIRYTDSNNVRHFVQARRIDDYCEFDDYDTNDFRHEYHQLYAVGRPDTEARFDEFELTRSYNAKALAMSIVPGWGQIYKGQTAKGCAIIGVEAVAVAAIALGEHKRSYMMDEAVKPGNIYDSWKGKANSWRNVRNVGIGVAVATYVYNLIDAATSRGARRVNIRRRSGEGVAVVPAITSDGAAMTFSYTF